MSRTCPDAARIATLLLVLCLLAPLPGIAAVERLLVPLNIDFGHIERHLGEALGADEQGLVTLDADECNHFRLEGLEVEADHHRLILTMDMLAATGTRLMGRCIGPGTWQGQGRITLVPRVDDSGLSVDFAPEQLELRRPDGTAGLLTPATRLLAEHLILPRLAAVRIDLAPTLASIDLLLAEFLPPPAQAVSPLADSSRLDQLEVLAEGLSATLAVSLASRPEQPVTAEPALDAEELAEWQRIEDELDGFLTVLTLRLAFQIDNRDLRLDLFATLLDSRYQIAHALAEDDDHADPVRVLFVDAWQRLRPLLYRLDALDVADDFDLRLAGFIAAGDALALADALGPAWGLEISRDGLRRLARMLLAEQAPDSFTPLPLGLDPALRELIGLGAHQPDRPSGNLRKWRWHDWLIAPAHAARRKPPAEALRGLVPRLAILDDYLALVSRLLDEQVSGHLGAESRLAPEFRSLFDPLVRATAWKESCWRHYVGPSDQPQVIRSSAGAVGMMQILGRVWRGVYDINRLETDIDYNVQAGIEILEHYLVDYAIRRGEHQQPGGLDNLVRATYAAYNGGPSHLTRYRRDDTAPRLRAIDNEFWRHFQQMRGERWPDVASCFPVG